MALPKDPFAILTVLISLAPKVIEIAKAGQAAWVEFLETMKIEGDDALNAKLDEIGENALRIKLIAEFEANN